MKSAAVHHRNCCIVSVVSTSACKFPAVIIKCGNDFRFKLFLSSQFPSMPQVWRCRREQSLSCCRVSFSVLMWKNAQLCGAGPTSTHPQFTCVNQKVITFRTKTSITAGERPWMLMLWKLGTSASLWKIFNCLIVATTPAPPASLVLNRVRQQCSCRSRGPQVEVSANKWKITCSVRDSAALF